MRKARKKLLSDINVVPYIDVMLVLLIVFMITTPLLKQGIQVDLPSAASHPVKTTHTPPLIISINHLGETFINANKNPRKNIKKEQLKKYISNAIQTAKNKGENQQVYIQADKHLEYQNVVSVMNLAREAGAEKIGLITKNQINNARG